MKFDPGEIESNNKTKSYKIHDMSELKREEVSHGSTTNQPSMYQTSYNSTEYNTKSFCCDLSFVLFLFVSSVFLVLAWMERIPAFKNYFRTHPHNKGIVLALGCLVVVLVFTVFLFRCFRRNRCVDRFKRKKSPFYNRFSSSRDSLDVKENNISNNDLPNHVSCNPKLSELGEDVLEKLKRILGNFVDEHSENDWLFSPSSLSNMNRKGGLCENHLYKHVEESVQYKFSIKVILVGQPNVGKTSIFHRILYDRFSEYYMATLGADLAHVSLHLYPGHSEDHVMISLQLWDIAGSERFSELSHIVYKDATAFIVICDVTNPNYASQVSPWVNDIVQLKYEPYVALFHNKIDITMGQKHLTPNLSSRHIDELINNLDSHPVSAKTGDKVLENVIKVLTKSTLHEISKLL